MPLRETIQLGRPIRDARALIAAFPGVVTASPHNAATEQAAYERGKQDGERALSEQLLRQRGELIELQNGVLKSLNDSITHVTSECEGAMVALALEIAGKLVADIPISTEMVEGAVREALASVEQNSKLVVLLNPMDFEMLQTANAPVLLTDVGGERMKFQPSPQVTRGGCMIQTNFGIVDARRETKLEALKQSLEQ
jgi:flagellar assembly protein FliH